MVIMDRKSITFPLLLKKPFMTWLNPFQYRMVLLASKSTVMLNPALRKDAKAVNVENNFMN
jgi:hypothetical protein